MKKKNFILKCVLEKDEVKFALAKTSSPVKVATYKTVLPDKKLIIQRMEQFAHLNHKL